MVVLKKIKGSTLMETMVATVLVVIVFMIASMVLNNLFGNSIRANNHNVETRLSYLEYFSTHNQLVLPYTEEFEGYKITIERKLNTGKKVILLEAFNPSINKTISKTRIESNH